jgi:acyl-CoA thioester hydrolase
LGRAAKLDAGFRAHVDIEPRFRDTDAMGHVNNAVYVTYLEVARQDYWRRLTGSNDYGRVPFVVARIEIDLQSPLLVGEIVRVFLRTSWVSRSSFEMEYVLHERDQGRCIATARTVLVTYDYAQNVSMPVPDSIRQALESMEGGPLPGRAPARP